MNFGNKNESFADNAPQEESKETKVNIRAKKDEYIQGIKKVQRFPITQYQSLLTMIDPISFKKEELTS